MTLPASKILSSPSKTSENRSQEDKLYDLESLVVRLSKLIAELTSRVEDLESSNKDLVQSNLELQLFVNRSFFKAERDYSSPKAPPNTPSNLLMQRKSAGAVSTGDESNGCDELHRKPGNSEVEALPEKFLLLKSPEITCSAKREGARCPRLEDTYTK
jgi:hypothetical protein